MKTITNLLILSLFLMGLTFDLFAQDQIHKKNSEIINCKVKEIGMDEIKYTQPDYPQDVLFVIDKDKVLKVVFSDGKELYFQKEMTNPENYEDNRKNAIKIDFLSPLTGNTTFAYERSLRPGRSIEATLGIIGLGANPNDYDPLGVFIKFGPKFIKSPDFYLRGMKYAHILKGGYIKPEFSIGYYSRYFEEWFDNRKERDEVLNATIMLNIGKQWIFDNSFLVDFYFGVGYGFDTDDRETEYHYSHLITSEEVPLSFGAGLKIGWLFK
jgi:hypothetical protein